MTWLEISLQVHFILQITESALKAAETVQKKYAEYQKFYTKEVERLNAKIKEITNESLAKQRESERTIKDVSQSWKTKDFFQQ